MRLPIVFIHEGNQNYLRHVLYLAQKENNLVYLIGDDSNKNFCDKWISNQMLDVKRFNAFSGHYSHMSSNSYNFELSCFKRFYYLKEFMMIMKVDKCVMLDSDLCIYTTITDHLYTDYDVGLAVSENKSLYRWSASPHNSFWTIDALDSFIDYFEDVYINNKELLEEKWLWHKKNKIPGGICDMTLLYLWIINNNIKYLNTNIAREGMFFNDNYYGSDNYLLNEYKTDSLTGCKKVIFENGKPFCIKANSFSKVQAMSIHCQGESKRYIWLLSRCVRQRWPYIFLYVGGTLKYKIKSLFVNFQE